MASQGTDRHIWGDDDQSRACCGRLKKRHLCGLGALLAASAVVVGLSVGLTVDVTGNSDAVGQATDEAAIGCFNDRRRSRVLSNRLTDDAMTPQMCQEHCGGYDAAYYALQWGVECWCGDDSVDLGFYAEDGDAVCDYACGGNDDMICGGYLTFTAYDIDTDATEATTSSETSSTTSSSTSERIVGDATDTCTGESTYSWSESSNLVSVYGGGCATLTDLYNAYPDGPLKILDDEDAETTDGVVTNNWLLMSSITIYEGGLFQFNGEDYDGDCNTLRIQSDGSSDFHEIRGHGGSLSFKGTKVTSWDTSNGVQQTDYEDGRSFINCVSEMKTDNAECAQNNYGECRMDIIDSEMGDLGWFDSESYGLTWKVRGFCPELTNPEVFDEVNVYGDLQGSNIYGMYYGMYSYGHDGGVWTNNVMHDNILYGFDPHDDSDNLEIANNEVYGNGNHGIIASKRCDNVLIHDNEVYDGGASAAGIFLHRSSDNAEVYNNYVHDMQDAGMAIMESMDNLIYDNVFENVKYGLRISLGGAGNQIYDNTFDTCSQYGLYTYEGSDDPDVSDGLPKNNVFTNNSILLTDTGVKITDGEDNEFIGNTFTTTDGGSLTLQFEDSAGTVWSGNSVPSGTSYSGDSVPDGFSDDDDDDDDDDDA